MRFQRFAPLILAAVLLMLGTGSATAQQHRATHLGNPATRFAPPMSKPEDLRQRFSDPKLRADIVSILRQWGWKGNVEDLFRAAASERITEAPIAPGTRLPFMSSRDKGRPIVLRDVLWAGKQPAPAYAFLFSSNGRRYRCLTPKACSNFLVIDLGPEVPELELELTAQAEGSICDPLKVQVLLRNSGRAPLTGVRLSSVLPPELSTRSGTSTWALDIGPLRAGEVRILEETLIPKARGQCRFTVKATSIEGKTDEASRQVKILGPRLTLECTAPGGVPIGRPVEVCLSFRNTGDAAETGVQVTLTAPPGTSLDSASDGGVITGNHVVWNAGRLEAAGKRHVCATLIRQEPGSLEFTGTIHGACSEPVETKCQTEVSGVPGILLEVIDVEDPVEVGRDVIYEIRITNQGSEALTNVRPVCSLPDIQEFVSGEGTTPVASVDGKPALEPVALLNSKATATWRVVTRALTPGTALFQVELTCDQLRRGSGEGETTNQY